MQMNYNEISLISFAYQVQLHMPLIVDSAAN